MFDLRHILEFAIDRFDNGPYLEKCLLENDINAPLMLLFNLVISCIPSTNNLSKDYC